MITVLQYIAGTAMLLGAFFSLLAAIGILRLPDLYTRMHAASKVGAMGSGLMFLAISVVALDSAVLLRAIVGFVFILLTTPVSAHLLARAAILSGYRPASVTSINELDSNNIS